MSGAEFDQADLERRMQGAINSLEHEFATLRTGRANASLVDHITIDAYGAKMPLNQLATINVPEPRMLSIQVWDKQHIQTVEKAIMDSDLGINPLTEGAVIRLPMPDLTEERRKEMIKIAHKYAEQSKIAIRNVRRDGMDKLKHAEKEGMSEDEFHMYGDEVQSLTDKFVKEVDEHLETKEKDILTI